MAINKDSHVPQSRGLEMSNCDVHILDMKLF